MLDKLNPFKRTKSSNPLDSLTEDELRTARKKLELARERTLRQIRDLEAQKARLLEEGAHSDLRGRRDKAHQILDTDEQVRQLDMQHDSVAKEIRFINRLTFLKQNSQQVGELVIDELLGKLDSGKLRNYIEEITIRGSAGSDRLDNLVDMFDQSWDQVVTPDGDPKLAQILELMEQMSMPALPDIPGTVKVEDGSDANRQNNVSQP